MSTPKKSTEGVKAATLESFVPAFTKNVERVAQLQKKSLEAAAGQNAEFIETCKKAFNMAPETPGLFVFDLLGQAFENFVESEKSAIDLAVEQNKSIAKLAEERSGSATKVVEGVTSVFEQSLQQTIAAQKKALEFIAERQKTATEAAKEQFRIVNPFAEAFQSGFDVLFETQKSLLDFASKPIKRPVAA